MLHSKKRAVIGGVQVEEGKGESETRRAFEEHQRQVDHVIFALVGFGGAFLSWFGTLGIAISSVSDEDPLDADPAVFLVGGSLLLLSLTVAIAASIKRRWWWGIGIGIVAIGLYVWLAWTVLRAP